MKTFRACGRELASQETGLRVQVKRGPALLKSAASPTTSMARGVSVYGADSDSKNLCEVSTAWSVSIHVHSLLRTIQ